MVLHDTSGRSWIKRLDEPRSSQNCKFQGKMVVEKAGENPQIQLDEMSRVEHGFILVSQVVWSAQK